MAGRGIATGVAAGCVALALGATVLGASPSASAVPGPPTRLQQAENLAAARRAALARARAAVTAQGKTLAALRTRAEVLTERYDQATLAEQQASDAYAVAVARLTAARRTERADAKRLGAQAAADLEAGAGQGQLELVLGGVGASQDRPDGYFAAISLEEVLADNRIDLVAANQAESAVTTVFAREADAALAHKRAVLAAARALRSAVQAAVAVQLLTVRAGKARQATVQAQLDRAEKVVADLTSGRGAGAGTGTGTGTGTAAGDGDFTLPAVPAGPAATAVQGVTAANWALTQLGKPYRWGGTGPGTYDCSGLTMDAWARAGVWLAHWTGYQWTSGPHVPLTHLRVGDLVFYATNTADPATIHHVGIYLGGGMMVDAPYTGAAVRIDSIHQYAGLIGATRPAARPGAGPTAPARSANQSGTHGELPGEVLLSPGLLRVTLPNDGYPDLRALR
jgi:cell wall-associated NlpC family hydrolase